MQKNNDEHQVEMMEHSGMSRGEETVGLHAAWLGNILENIVDGLITIDENGIIQSYNKACEGSFGFLANEVMGQHIAILMPHEQFLANFRITGKARFVGADRGLTGHRKDGSTFPMDLAVAEVKVGERTFFSGIVRDITDFKKAEEQLLRSNQELEQFAYVASHDLKTPLRNIDDLAKWVIEDDKDNLTAEMRTNLTLLRTRVSRLEILLDDILAYSRAGRIMDDAVEVDVNELLGHLLQTHVPKAFAVTITGKLPKLTSPPTPLSQVFGNILANAIKHHDRETGTIEIQSKRVGNFYEFVVIDDGPGIPPEYHERVFQMFQTLKSRDKVSGSGMGMAIIKKLVEWQGGKVWIASEKGKRGTAVHFLWSAVASPELRVL